MSCELSALVFIIESQIFFCSAGLVFVWGDYFFRIKPDFQWPKKVKNITQINMNTNTMHNRCRDIGVARHCRKVLNQDRGNEQLNELYYIAGALKSEHSLLSSCNFCVENSLVKWCNYLKTDILHAIQNFDRFFLKIFYIKIEKYLSSQHYLLCSSLFNLLQIDLNYRY